MSYFEDVYLKRMNVDGNTQQERTKTRKEKEFDKLFLKKTMYQSKIYKVNHEETNLCGSLQPNKCNESELISNLLISTKTEKLKTGDILSIYQKIKDEELLQLLDEIIDSAEGVPIGNYLSQFFTNLYLAYFDHWIKEILKVIYYFRYCDDITILGSSKEELHEQFLKIQEYLEVNLKLQVKPNWQIYPVEARGIDFVGYVFRHKYTRLRKSIKHNLFVKVSGQAKQFSYKKDRVAKIGSYFGWLKYCNSKHFLQKIEIQTRLCYSNFIGEEELIFNTYNKNIRVIDIQLSNKFFIIHFYYHNKPYWLKSSNKKLLKKLKLYERTQKNNV